MFAVIKTGGKQYKVKKNYSFAIEKIEGSPGSEIKFSEVLMFGIDTKPVVVGTPTVKGVSVVAKIISQKQDDKVLVFKKKRRQNYRRKRGHRQEITQIQIVDINVDSN